MTDSDSTPNPPAPQGETPPSNPSEQLPTQENMALSRRRADEALNLTLSAPKAEQVPQPPSEEMLEIISIIRSPSYFGKGWYLSRVEAAALIVAERERWAAEKVAEALKARNKIGVALMGGVTIKMITDGIVYICTRSRNPIIENWEQHLARLRIEVGQSLERFLSAQLATAEQQLRRELEQSRKFWQDSTRDALRDKDQQLAALQRENAELKKAPPHTHAQWKAFDEIERLLDNTATLLRRLVHALPSPHPLRKTATDYLKENDLLGSKFRESNERDSDP